LEASGDDPASTRCNDAAYHYHPTSSTGAPGVAASPDDLTPPADTAGAAHQVCVCADDNASSPSELLTTVPLAVRQSCLQRGLHAQVPAPEVRDALLCARYLAVQDGLREAGLHRGLPQNRLPDDELPGSLLYGVRRSRLPLGMPAAAAVSQRVRGASVYVGMRTARRVRHAQL